MVTDGILFQNGKPYTPWEIQNKILSFKESYKKATDEVIRRSINLDANGRVFEYCSALILNKFLMTRSGPFQGIRVENRNVINGKILTKIWEVIGNDILHIRRSISNSGLPRDRYILELSQNKLNTLTEDIWKIFKLLLFFTTPETRYGLVGASKILFSVLPEIVLPVDTEQWLMFKTVDIGDIIKVMVSEIKQWENATSKKLDQIDPKRRLITLPSVYNVMAMAARNQ